MGSPRFKFYDKRRDKPIANVTHCASILFGCMVTLAFFATGVLLLKYAPGDPPKLTQLDMMQHIADEFNCTLRELHVDLSQVGFNCTSDLAEINALTAQKEYYNQLGVTQRSYSLGVMAIMLSFMPGIAGYVGSFLLLMGLFLSCNYLCNRLGTSETPTVNVETNTENMIEGDVESANDNNDNTSANDEEHRTGGQFGRK